MEYIEGGNSVVTNRQNSNPFLYFLKRGITILRTDGAANLVKRIKDRVYRKPQQSHCYVVIYNSGMGAPAPVPRIPLEIKEVTGADDDEINQIVELDEWKMSKSSCLRNLKEGSVCYIAKHEGRVIGCNWVVLASSEEPVFRRQFTLSPNETYHRMGWCIPAFRGKGVIPFLLRDSCDKTARRYGKAIAYGFVRANNRSMHRGLTKAGWTRVGRAGFIEIFGIRFQYLWGREAFKETRRRFFIQNMG